MTLRKGIIDKTAKPPISFFVSWWHFGKSPRIYYVDGPSGSCENMTEPTSDNRKKGQTTLRVAAFAAVLAMGLALVPTASAVTSKYWIGGSYEGTCDGVYDTNCWAIECWIMFGNHGPVVYVGDSAYCLPQMHRVDCDEARTICYLDSMWCFQWVAFECVVAGE